MIMNVALGYSTDWLSSQRLMLFDLDCLFCLRARRAPTFYSFIIFTGIHELAKLGSIDEKVDKESTAHLLSDP